MRRFVFFILFFAPAFVFSQVLNMEEERDKTDSIGWTGKAEVSFDIVKTDDKLVDLELDILLAYKAKRSLYLFLTDYSHLNSGTSEFTNSGYEHIRYNYNLADWYAWEAFGQAQYDVVLGLKFRGLLGTGPRFKLHKSKKFSLYAAWLYMFEYEEMSKSTDIDRNHRISSYASFSWKLTDNLSLISTTYFQPLINNFNDFRIFSQTDFKIKILKKIDFTVGYTHYYDSDPPEGVVSTIYSLENKLSIGF